MKTTQSTGRGRVIGLTGAAGALALMAVTAGALPAAADTEVEPPATFTSAFTAMATPDQIFNPDGENVPGEAGATGTFTFMINSDEEIICYDITVEGVTPPYMSMARTATHIHQNDPGMPGPPRISFPDPTGDGVLTSSGCLQGPFTTGLEGDDGVDTGEGFTLAQIEANPANFYADTHTHEYMLGAVRGQLSQVPVGGVETGMGGQASLDRSGVLLTGAAAALLGLGATGALVARRHGRG